MKKLALLALLTGSMAFGQVKKIVKSDINWWGYKIAKTEASSHTGTVNLKSGNVKMKGNAFVGGTFVLDMTSINATDLTGEYQTKLNNHLKNGDFFEVDKYPTATYTITSVKRNADKNYNFTVNGNLTLKGITKAVSFPAKITASKGTVYLVSDKFSIDRQLFNVSYKSAIQDVLVKDNIDLQVNVSAK